MGFLPIYPIEMIATTNTTTRLLVNSNTEKKNHSSRDSNPRSRFPKTNQPDKKEVDIEVNEEVHLMSDYHRVDVVA